MYLKYTFVDTVKVNREKRQQRFRKALESLSVEELDALEATLSAKIAAREEQKVNTKLGNDLSFFKLIP